MSADVYHDRNGRRIDRATWATLFTDPAYRFIARDDVGFVHVSTVWIGLSVTGRGVECFETIVYNEGAHSRKVPRSWGYASADAARAGHRALVALLRAGGTVAELPT